MLVWAFEYIDVAIGPDEFVCFAMGCLKLPCFAIWTVNIASNPHCFNFCFAMMDFACFAFLNVTFAMEPYVMASVSTY